MSKKPRTEIPNTPFGFIFFAIRPYQKWFNLNIVLVLIYQLFNNLQSVVFKGFVDSANSYSQNGVGSINTVFLWVITYPILILLAALSLTANSFVLNYLQNYSRTNSIKKLFEYLTLHSMSYFNDRLSGSLSSRVNTISKNVTKLIGEFYWAFLALIFNLIITTIIIATADTNLAWAFIAGFIILIPVNILLTRPQVLLSRAKAKSIAKLTGLIIDTMTNISAVQLFSRRNHEIESLELSIKEHLDITIKSVNHREKVFAINKILAALFIGGAIVWAFLLWSKGMMTIGEFVMIVSITSGFMYSLTFIGHNVNSIMESYGEVSDGIKEIIRPHGITDKPGAKKLSTREGKVEFSNVGFNYSDDPRKVFENLFLSAKSGEKVGVVGTSGAGKTTLVKLLLRQHDVTHGKISVDGHDIKDLTQESLREHISIVPQEPMLFHRTIRENILYGKLDATEEEMIEVARKAQAHDFIETLPKKYDSLVGERGVKLSVGQRQRVAIARAFLKNSPILILDEATSALDSESEVAVQTALQNLMEGKTVFAIAHRLSTLREMDRILVFKDGKIVEDGTHRALLRDKEGVYASLWHHQAGGFLKDDDESEVESS